MLHSLIFDPFHLKALAYANYDDQLAVGYADATAEIPTTTSEHFKLNGAAS